VTGRPLRTARCLPAQPSQPPVHDTVERARGWSALGAGGGARARVRLRPHLLQPPALRRGGAVKVHDELVELAQRGPVADGQHGDALPHAGAVQHDLAVRAHLARGAGARGVRAASGSGSMALAGRLQGSDTHCTRLHGAERPGRVSMDGVRRCRRALQGQAQPFEAERVGTAGGTSVTAGSWLAGCWEAGRARTAEVHSSRMA